jgi:hypothetical protein
LEAKKAAAVSFAGSIPDSQLGMELKKALEERTKLAADVRAPPALELSLTWCSVAAS